MQLGQKAEGGSLKKLKGPTKDVDQYLLIPFLGGWTSIYQLFWCELQGYKVLTHCHVGSQPKSWCWLDFFSKISKNRAEHRQWGCLIWGHVNGREIYYSYITYLFGSGGKNRVLTNSTADEDFKHSCWYCLYLSLSWVKQDLCDGWWGDETPPQAKGLVAPFFCLFSMTNLLW